MYSYLLTDIHDEQEQKDTEIKELKNQLSHTIGELNKLKGEHSNCNDIFSLNQQCLEKLQRENAEFTTKQQSLCKEIEALRIKCDEQKQIISEKKMSVEKYKVEII